MTKPRTLADYRPQHDEDCEIYNCSDCGWRQTEIHHWSPPVDEPDKWVRHTFRARPCSCGLDALLRAEDPRPLGEAKQSYGTPTLQEIARQAAENASEHWLKVSRADLSDNRFAHYLADAVAVAVVQFLHGESDVYGPRHFYHFDQYLTELKKK